MPNLTARIEPVSSDADEISLFALGNSLLRHRRMLSTLIAVGAAIGLAAGLRSPRVFRSSATFIPQGSEGGASGFALAASQLGIRVPSTNGGGWGPPIYVDLLGSRALLEPIALDTVVVSEESGHRIPIVDLLEVKASTAARRVDLAVSALRGMVTPSEVKTLGGVQVSVTTRWPSVSLAIAQRLVRGVNEFNLQTRKSQATAERQFAEAQAAEAESALRAAEDRLQSFLQGNRIVAGSSQLGFDQDRLQREVQLRQQVYTSLLQSREEAKIREVRDTPVITVIEDPRLPLIGESRKVAQKALVGAFVGVLIGLLIVLMREWLTALRGAPNEEVREFFRLLQDATPRSLRRLRNKVRGVFQGEE